MDLDIIQLMNDAVPSWTVRLVTQLGIYFLLTAAAYLAIRLVRNRPPSADDDTVYARMARFCVLGYEPTSGVVVSDPQVRKASMEGDGPSASERSRALQAIMITYATVGLLVSYLSWGVLQERIMSTEYATGRFESSNFLVFSNRMFALGIAYPMVWYRGEGFGRAPFYKYAFTSLSNTLSSWCQLEALKFVSFPTQVLAKSSKIVPVMVMGRVLSGKQYPWYEYGVAVVIGAGVSLFMYSQQSGQQHQQLNQVTEVSGVVLMLGYLAFDSFTSQWQDVLFKEYELSSYQMMVGINAFSAIFTLVAVAQSGELVSSIDFLIANPDCALHICGFSLAGAVGQTFIFFTIREFGPLVFTIITSTRQLVAVVLSVVIYGHHIAAEGLVGAGIVFGAIAYRVWRKEDEGRQRKEASKKAKSSEVVHRGDEEAATPLVEKKAEG